MDDDRERALMAAVKQLTGLCSSLNEDVAYLSARAALSDFIIMKLIAESELLISLRAKEAKTLNSLINTALKIDQRLSRNTGIEEYVALIRERTVTEKTSR